MSGQLEHFEILSELAADERDLLEQFLDERSLPQGRRVFTQNEEAGELLLLREGRMRLQRGKEVLGELGAGTALGGACLARIGKRACTAEAIEALSLLTLSRESYLRLRADYPTIALGLQEGLVRAMAGDVEQLLLEDG